MLGLGSIAKKVFGTTNDRRVRAAKPVVDKINALEPEFEQLSDQGLIDKTAELKARVADGESLDDVLPDAFANCREAARRALGLRAFDVQLMGGIFLHQGNIAEQKTGEGKTLTATFACYPNALTGKGVHVVTVNDYLVQRDAEWMGTVFAALGMTTGGSDRSRTEFRIRLNDSTSNKGCLPLIFKNRRYLQPQSLCRVQGEQGLLRHATARP